MLIRNPSRYKRKGTGEKEHAVLLVDLALNKVN